MPIHRPDLYRHNNEKCAFVDSDYVRGGIRTSVNTLDDLYGLSESIDQLKERSTIVYVENEDNYYELISCVNASNESGWTPFMGGTAPVTGASNGLSITNKNIILGGTLNTPTKITTGNNGIEFYNNASNKIDFGFKNTYSNSNFGVLFTNTGSTGTKWYLTGTSTTISLYHANSSSNYSCISVNNNCVVFNNTNSSTPKTVSLNTSGLTYASDYSGSYGIRSLVDKQYVDNRISYYANVNNVRIINNNGETTGRYDYFVGISGANCVYLYGQPICGQVITITDICGGALLDNINIDGNGTCINNDGTSRINTNYGSITYRHNGTFWSVVGFVN